MVVAGGELEAVETFGFCRTGAPVVLRRCEGALEVEAATADPAVCSTTTRRRQRRRNPSFNRRRQKP